MISVGTATMMKDGTIALQLRAEGPDGELGDAYFECRPQDKNYADVLKYVGDIAPGQSKMLEKDE